jgi:diadenosine tetraphosphate (Ap4A) HIT family hydrolase
VRHGSEARDARRVAPPTGLGAGAAARRRARPAARARLRAAAPPAPLAAAPDPPAAAAPRPAAAPAGPPRSKHHQPEPPPSSAPVEGCWFCLSSETVDVSLVASVGDESYVALDKGQITPTHALVVPIEHSPSLLSLPPAAGDEVWRYLSSLRAAFASRGLSLVGFERHLALRGKGGNHCHVNVLGVGPAAAAGAREAFEREAAAAGFELSHVPPKGGQLDRWGGGCARGGGPCLLE